MKSTPDTRWESAFTVLDWIGVVLALFLTMGLLGLPFAGASFVAMYADFAAELPALTRAAISWWFPLLWAAVALAALAPALRGGASLARRRLWIVLGFLVASLGFAACVVGLYLPIFALAGSIRPD